MIYLELDKKLKINNLILKIFILVLINN